MKNKLTEHFDELLALAVKAGCATLDYFNNTQPLETKEKSDHTPVTAADLASDEIIRTGLQILFPKIPVLTEETAKEYAWEERKKWSSYWLVDPLDGTRGFVVGDPNYTVNIALIENHVPIIGVIYLPVSGALYWGVKGSGSYRKAGLESEPELLKTRNLSLKSIETVVGRFSDGRHYLDHLETNPAFIFHHINSSYKFCLIAEASKDLYPKFSHISEWDTAAGQVILEEAGGRLLDSSGEPLSYNRTDSLLNPRFVALGDSGQEQQLLFLVFGEEKKNKGD